MPIPEDGHTSCALFPGWPRSWLKHSILPREGFWCFSVYLRWKTEKEGREYCTRRQAGFTAEVLAAAQEQTGAADQTLQRPFLEPQKGDPFKMKANQTEAGVTICMHFSSLLWTESALSQHLGSFVLLENIYPTNELGTSFLGL